MSSLTDFITDRYGIDQIKGFRIWTDEERRNKMKQSMKYLAAVLSFLLLLEIVPLPAPVSFTQTAYAAEMEEECTHEWSDWEEEEEPTCVDEGTKTRYCYLCGEEQSEPIKATGKHDWCDWEVVKKATIKKEGRKERDCLFCDKTQKKAIKKVKPFAKFAKKSYSVKAGKTKKLSVKYAAGDKIKKWKSGNTSVAAVNKKGKVTAKKAGTAKITVTLKSGKKATCKIKVTQAKKKNAKKKTAKKTVTRSSGGKVYWTPNGSVYHKSADCPTLSRSRTIKSGTIAQSKKKRCCKGCG